MSAPAPKPPQSSHFSSGSLTNAAGKRGDDAGWPTHESARGAGQSSLSRLGHAGWWLWPRLLDALDTGVQAALTLVAAPPGAGKSALLSSWIAEGRPQSPSHGSRWTPTTPTDAVSGAPRIEALIRVTGDERVGALAVSRRQRLNVDALLAPLVDAIDAARRARRPRPGRLPRGLGGAQGRPRAPDPVPARGVAPRARHARRPANRARAPAPRRATDRDPRRRPRLHPRRGRRAVRRSGGRAPAGRRGRALAAHGRVGRRAALGRPVAAAPSGARRLHRALRRHRRHRATTWSARSSRTSPRIGATSCCARRS